MKPLSLVLGFFPWIVFTFAANRIAADAVAWSALLAVAITAVALALGVRRRAPVTLDLASLALFGGMAVAGFAGGAGMDDWLFRWGRPLVGVVLGLYVLAAAGVRPFTEEYARQSTPREHWGSPAFRSINRVLSAAWGAGLVVIGLAGVLVTLIDEHATGRSSGHLAELALNWAVPIAVIWGLIALTGSYPDRVMSRLQPEAAAGRRSPSHA
ncbi:hypothetical protein [Modestobacter versicolor]|uniref:DUF3159 domain-containing protein n=1 Tax=Modestobacter versicolor TaxID=429133 RepID=A0A323VDR8_9ACTN|nr:hypothetical protein [Modestobacter versicolor]MBB3675190.1 hypothetical protein [Modestobacter versicolor]PZA22994.1 hypothetical protein DMO24_02210 [Modestobacter versicolor]